MRTCVASLTVSFVLGAAGLSSAMQVAPALGPEAPENASPLTGAHFDGRSTDDLERLLQELDALAPIAKVERDAAGDVISVELGQTVNRPVGRSERAPAANRTPHAAFGGAVGRTLHQLAGLDVKEVSISGDGEVRSLTLWSDHPFAHAGVPYHIWGVQQAFIDESRLVRFNFGTNIAASRSLHFVFENGGIRFFCQGDCPEGQICKMLFRDPDDPAGGDDFGPDDPPDDGGGTEIYCDCVAQPEP